MEYVGPCVPFAACSKLVRLPILTSFGYVLVQKSDNHHQNVPADTACSTLLGRLVILEYAHTVRPSAQLQEVGVK